MRRFRTLGEIWPAEAGRALCLALLLCLGAAPAFADDGPASFAPLVKKVLPAVVSIAVTEPVSTSEALDALPPALRGTPFEKQFRDQLRRRPEKATDAGAGFIIDASGIIVTNNHVVGMARDIEVSLADGTSLAAKVIGADELTDIAVLKVTPAHPLPAVTWGDSGAAEVGDWVIAAGNPFGLANSITAGIISARGRDIETGPFDDFLQIDAPVNPGNSGGPIFNMRGRVIGINTAIVSPSGGSVGIAFAIPSSEARGVVNELLAHGHIDRGWLGVGLEDLPENGQASGVAVTQVIHQGPAAQSGVRTGDVILSVNGQPVYNTQGLIRAVAAIPPGQRARLTLFRDGRAMQIVVVVGHRPPARAD
jgi:serine protease Do